MKFELLPVDILELVVDTGNLSVNDVLSLSSTNRTLRSKLTCETIWNRLFSANWGHVLFSYSIPVEPVPPKSSLPPSFAKCVWFNCLHTTIWGLINRYTPRGNTNFTVLLDQVLENPMYIPILVNIQPGLAPDLAVSSHIVDISREALVTNLLLACNYKLGFQFISKIYSQPACCHSLETLWLQLDYFNRHLSSLIQNRHGKLSRIRYLLHHEIYVNYIKYRRSPTVYVSNDHLHFKNEKAMVLLVLKISKVVLAQFSCIGIDKSYVDLERYFDDFFLEDYSILQVYSNMAKGHPMLIMSILIEEIHTFFKKFKIHINRTPCGLDIKLTKNFIKLRNYYLFLRPVNTTRHPYAIEIFTTKQVVSFLRGNFGYDEQKISQYLLPLTALDIIETFMNVKVPSISTLFAQERMATDSAIVKVSNWDDFEFVQFISKFLNYELRGGYRDFNYCSQFHKYMAKLNYFIHLKTIYKMIEKDDAKATMLTTYFNSQTTLSHFQFPRFTLTSQDITTFYSRVLGSIFNHQEVTKTGKFPTGTIVHHHRFNVDGIVVASTTSQEHEYHYVYTTNNTIEVYESTSITAIAGDKNTQFHHLTNVYNKCRHDIVGFLLFRAIDIDTMTFVPFV